MSILFSLWLWLKQWCWFWRCLSFLSDVCSQAAEQRRNVECFSSFQKLAWTPHPLLLGLLSICSISEVFYPSLTLMGPNSLGSVLFIYPPEDLSHSGSVQIYSSVSYLLRTASRHVKDFFGTPTRQPLCLTRAFQNLPQSSTFLQILYHWACWKRKKPSRNWPLLIRLTKKESVSLCCPLSLHEAVFSCLMLYIQALRGRDCHFNLYFSVLSTIAHDEASRHYSNINSSNKINMMDIPKVWLEKTTWSLRLSGPLFIQGQEGERAELSQ